MVVDGTSPGEPLDHERHQRFHALFVIQIGVTELLDHKGFFHPQFETEAQKQKNEAHKATQLSMNDCRTQISQQQAGINRMTDNTIRAALNQLMLFFDCDRFRSSSFRSKSALGSQSSGRRQ